MMKALKALFVLIAVGLVLAVTPMREAEAFDPMASIIRLSNTIVGMIENGQGRENLPHDNEHIMFHPKDLMVTIVNQEQERFRFDVELAVTRQAHEVGLMNREELPETSGMLFIFSKSDKRSFWMKDTLLPLDIIFIKENGRIDHIHSMAKPLDRSMITSPGDAKAVLEINGGLSDKLGIRRNDYVYHPVFRNLNLLEKLK